jgi:predicted membrane channel-forming protein YqfA (hemolysin III family)
MKKFYFTSLVLLLGMTFFSFVANAQAPQSMSYQTVIRNSSNVLLTNTLVGIKISVLQGSASGTAVFSTTTLAVGSYTPITMLALPFEQGLFLLIAIWSLTLLGIGFRVFWIGAPRWLYTVIYVGMGWGAIVYVRDFMAANLPMMILILAGGLAYTIGAVVYGLKRPNPIPKHFGFHEIFHALTVLAFGCHWTAALLIGLAPLDGSFAG